LSRDKPHVVVGLVNTDKFCQDLVRLNHPVKRNLLWRSIMSFGSNIEASSQQGEDGAKTCSVYIVDDHLIIRHALKDIVSAGGLVVVGEASNATDAMEGIANLNPDIAIVDLNLGEISGLELIEQIKDICPKTKVVVYTMRENIQIIAAAYRSGAMACVTKSQDPLLVLDAIEKVQLGERFYMQGILEKLAEFHANASPNEPSKVLTEREFEIFMLFARGLTLEKVAIKLGVAQGSISNRLVSIRKKLNITSPSGIALLAMEHGYLDKNSTGIEH
jgi:two-component system invasion response regulator UvrY